MTDSIIERIKSADNLPSLPSVAVEVLRLTQSDDASVSEIAEVIERDPALTGKMLKVANSSMFGLAREISSLQQATVVLGLRTVKVMVLSFSLLEMMDGQESEGFDYAEYWRRSLTTAAAARLLAEQVGGSVADEAFVGGLLCDLGILAAARCARELYAPVVTAYRAGGQTLQAAEQEHLGTTHETIGAELLRHWGLPAALCDAVSTHHAPVDAETPDGQAAAKLTRAVRAGAALSDLFCAEVAAGQLDACSQRIAAGLPIPEAALHEVLEALDKRVHETASLFDVEISPTLSVHEIRAQATAQLAQLSMAAEIERAQTMQREQEIRLQVEQLSEQNRKLAHSASTDGLTGIGNRAAFEQRLNMDFAIAIDQNRPLGLLMMDLDRFKKLNDTYGHQAGDQALERVGKFLKAQADDTHFPARYGGEEFVLVVLDASPEALRRKAEAIRQGIQDLGVPCEGQVIPVTVSVGAVHALPGDPDLEPKRLVAAADKCLYEAKRAGRNRVVLAEPVRPEPAPA